MLELATKGVLAAKALTLAQSYQLVQYDGNTYAPVHWETKEIGLFPQGEQSWSLLTRQDKRKLGNNMNILFSNDSEITNFDLMLKQYSNEVTDIATSLLIKTDEGLKELTITGELVDPVGTFYPNTLEPKLNTNPEDKAEVFSVFTDWLGSEEEAHSILHHFATALCPAWSAVKYVLLIGDGRNGKSVMLSMLTDVFGVSNVSNVTRQQMAERLPVVAELNSKLLNIVFDGEMAYIKDSSVEKTLIAGERTVVRMLYENGNTPVQTNALFIEALNYEPKTRDKSSALQKRLSRFFFPNVYPIDISFEKKMRSSKMLGAFLALLLDHFVQENEIATKLAQTAGALAMQVEQNILNSPIHQFINYLISQDVTMIDKLRNKPHYIDPFVDSFMAWRVNEGLSELSSADVKKMMKASFFTDWKTFRENGKVVKRQRIVGVKPDIEALLAHLEGDKDANPEDPVVA